MDFPVAPKELVSEVNYVYVPESLAGCSLYTYVYVSKGGTGNPWGCRQFRTLTVVQDGRLYYGIGWRMGCNWHWAI